MNSKDIFSHDTDEEGFAPLADVMGFVAIVWVVLFVLFARLSSPSLEGSDDENINLQNGSSVDVAATLSDTSKNEEVGADVNVKNKGAKSNKSIPDIQITSRRDLLELLRNDVMTLYGIAESDAFELLYHAIVGPGERISFSLVETIPTQNGWKLSDDYSDFLITEMVRENPTIASYPRLRIIMFIKDHDLEMRIDAKISSLIKTGKTGTLEIDATKKISFREN